MNAVKFFPHQEGASQVILSGSVDKTIRVWQAETASPTGFCLLACLEGHEGSINCLAVFKGTSIFASASADATIRIWRIESLGVGAVVQKVQIIHTKPRFFVLTLALHSLGAGEDLLLAAAGTKSMVHVFVASRNNIFDHQVTLSGHESWIRSLSITHETGSAGSDLLLASAGQDKYIRLWRVTQGKQKSTLKIESAFENLQKSLSNKEHKLSTSHDSYSVSFEALLHGHEDWIYTISWRLGNDSLRLLSASADSSLAIWECEPSSGVWVCITRLGELNAQNGSTTATGSIGGFYIGLWSPDGEKLVSLGRSGSWRLWNYNNYQDRWLQGVGISGHTKSIADAAWSQDGSYLLSTGLDQTTRLHAVWKRGTTHSWHEMARPQIHGYDLNCIDSICQIKFISGADEKLLRVFDEPRATADLLKKVCGIRNDFEQNLLYAANVPVLGLSNKAIESPADGKPTTDGHAHSENLALDGESRKAERPPLEDQLARHTLWPEREKLYGHGHEISAVASSHDGTVVATSCRASSLEHATIRLYTTKDWREVKPSLKAHALTVTTLCFSSDDQYLISVGRDRQWVIFERDSGRPGGYFLKHSNLKGHSRMILDACWAPLDAGRVFATASRDKTVKIWKISAMDIVCTTTIVAASSMTTVDIHTQLSQEDMVVASGTETGNITLHILQPPNWIVKQMFELDKT